MTDKEVPNVSAAAQENVTIEGPGAEMAVRRTASQELVRQVRSETFKAEISAALREDISADKFVRATITALLQNPDLAEKASPDSIFQSIIRCAQDGLLPDGHEAALVIFKGKAQYLPMIGGFRKIAAEHGWAIRTAVVYSNDEFSYTLGLEPTLVHNPAPITSERGDRVGAYAIAAHRDGRREIEVMSAADVEKIRNVSRSKDNGPWRDWTDRMWEKTPGRRLFAKLPLDPGDRRVASIRSIPEIDDDQSFSALYGGADEPKIIDAFVELKDDAATLGEGTASGQQATVEADPPPASADAPGTEDSPAAASGEQTPEPEVIPSSGPAPGAGDEAPETPPETPPAPPPTSEPVIPGVAATVAEEKIDADALAEAVQTKLPSGSYQGRTIGWVLEVGPKADPYLDYALRQPWPLDQDFKQALTLAIRAHRPAMYAAWRAEA